MVKKGNKGNREPVAVERLQLGQMHLSRVTLLEAYLEAWEQPSHVCGVIWDKIKECYIKESGFGGDVLADDLRQESGNRRQNSDWCAAMGKAHDMHGEESLEEKLPNTDWRNITGPVCDTHSKESLEGKPPNTDWCNITGPVCDMYAEESSDVGHSNADGSEMAGQPGENHILRIRRGGVNLRELHRCFPDYQVWDRSFQRYLQRHQMAWEWMRVWRIPVFDQYGGLEQLQTLQDYVEGWQQLSQILVLGRDPDMSTWLPKLLRRARGIDFYLEYEPRDMEDIQEWINEEYGLVTQWHILGSRTSADVGQVTGRHAEEEAAGMVVRKTPAYPGLSQYLRSYRMPCLVLDFTGVADIPMTGLKPGSMWWDMGAMEEKRHLLEDRPLGVRYVSLKTLWRDLV